MRYHVVLVTRAKYTRVATFHGTPEEAAKRHLEFWRRHPFSCWTLRDATGRRHSVSDSRFYLGLLEKEAA